MTIIKRSTTCESFHSWAEAVNWHRLFVRQGDGQSNARYTTPDGKQFYLKWDANGGLVDMVELHLVQNQTVTQVIQGRVATPAPAQRPAPSTSAANSRREGGFPPAAPPAPIKTSVS